MKNKHFYTTTNTFTQEQQEKIDYLLENDDKIGCYMIHLGINYRTLIRTYQLCIRETICSWKIITQTDNKKEMNEYILENFDTLVKESNKIRI